MTPAYSVGSIVFVERCTADEIMQSDVITFHMGFETDYVMTHRVLEK